MSFSLQSCSGNHLQSLNLEPIPLAFFLFFSFLFFSFLFFSFPLALSKSLSVPNSLYQASPFLLKYDSNKQ